MSQHFYSANYQGKQIMVLCGWDRPMQQYFLVIEYEELTDDITDEDAYIYSNLFDDSSMHQELVYFQQKLDAFGINLPKSMMDQVREDRLNNVDNRQCLHHSNGTYTADGILQYCH